MSLFGFSAAEIHGAGAVLGHTDPLVSQLCMITGMSVSLLGPETAMTLSLREGPVEEIWAPADFNRARRRSNAP
jgi:hypothetical protein